MKEMLFNIGDIPAVLYGDDSDKLYLFVHGKHGCKEEARPFAEIVCPKGWQVLAVDLPRHVPATTPLSDQISKDLKKLGFKFVGSTIVYAFMQAIGMVNDHTADCFLFEANQR